MQASGFKKSLLAGGAMTPRIDNSHEKEFLLDQNLRDDSRLLQTIN